MTIHHIIDEKTGLFREVDMIGQKEILLERKRLGYKSYTISEIKQLMSKKNKVIEVSHSWLEINGKCTQYRICRNSLQRCIIQYAEHPEKLRDCVEILIHSSEHDDVEELRFLFDFVEYAEKNKILFKGSNSIFKL